MWLDIKKFETVDASHDQIAIILPELSRFVVMDAKMGMRKAERCEELATNQRARVVSVFFQGANATMKETTPDRISVGQRY